MDGRRSQLEPASCRCQPVPYLLKLVCYHSKGLEDGIGRACDGDNSLRAVSLRDVDPGTTLQWEKRKRSWQEGKAVLGRPGFSRLANDLRQTLVLRCA